MSTLPNKWAVEITSLQDAEKLQESFPKDEDLVAVQINGNRRYNGHYFMDNENGLWAYSDRLIYEFEGYTILSLTELKELIK